MTAKQSIPDFVKSEYLNIGQLSSNLGWSVRFIEGIIQSEKCPNDVSSPVLA